MSGVSNHTSQLLPRVTPRSLARAVGARAIPRPSWSSPWRPVIQQRPPSLCSRPVGYRWPLCTPSSASTACRGCHFRWQNPSKISGFDAWALARPQRRVRLTQVARGPATTYCGRPHRKQSSVCRLFPARRARVQIRVRRGRRGPSGSPRRTSAPTNHQRRIPLQQRVYRAACDLQ